MSLIGVTGGGDPRPSGLERRQLGVEFDMVDEAVQSLVAQGQEQGIIDDGLMNFAAAILREKGRAGALLLPTLDLIQRHVVLSRLESDPEAAPKQVYAREISYRDGSISGKTVKYKWEQQWQQTPEYVAPITRKISIDTSVVVADSPRELDHRVAFKHQQAEALANLKEAVPLAGATSVVEAAFGGIDITKPERSVRELGSRLLTSALIHQLHEKEQMHPTSVVNRQLIHPSLQAVFMHGHGEAYNRYLTRVTSAAALATADGGIEAERIDALNSMITQDTARFLGEAWDDIEALTAYSRLPHIGDVLGYLRVSSGF